MPDKAIAYLVDVFPYDPEKHLFTIPVSVERYADLFNTWDPSPIHHRDLAPDLTTYLNNCSSEIPLPYRVGIVLTIRLDGLDSDSEQKTSLGLHNFFRYEANVIRQQLAMLRRWSLKYALLSFFSIATSVLLTRLPGNNLLLDFIRTGFEIGGWVFLWEAIARNFIQADEINHSIRMLERLEQAEIQFEYSE